MNLHIPGLRKLLGLPVSDDGAPPPSPDFVHDPKTQMAIALAAVKRPEQVYGGTVPTAEKLRRRNRNKAAASSRRINRRSR